MSLHQPTPQQGLDSSAERYRPLVEGHPHAILLVDREGTILLTSPAARQLLGYADGELAGTPLETLFPERHYAEYRENWHGFVAEATGQEDRVVTLVHGDGTEVRADVSFDPLRAPDELHVLVTISDPEAGACTEARLQETEARYESLVESLPLNVFGKDLQGRFVFANQRCLRLMKLSLDELVGKTDFDLFPESLARKYRHDDLQVITSGEVFEDVEAYQNTSGLTNYVQVLKAPIRNARGEIVGIQGMFWDVSPRKRAEQALLESETRKRSVLNAALDAVVMIDAGGAIIEFNRAAEATFGFTAEEAVGRRMVDLVFPDESQEAFARVCEELGRSGNVEPFHGRRFETTAMRKSGERFEAELSMQSIPLEGETAYAVFVRDVTEALRAKAALERERFLLHSLMDHVPDAIYFKSVDGRFLRMNSAQARRLGLSSPDEAKGKSDADFFSREFAEETLRDERRVMETGEPLVGKEEEVLWEDGTRTWMSTTKVPLWDDEGRVMGTFGISRDVTLQKQAEEALRESKEAAEAASKAKSDFLANTSHEIRTPLNAIIGMADLLLDEEGFSPRQREYMGIIRDSGESLLDVINDILDFSKIEAGRLELDERVFDLRETVGDIMKSLAVRAHRAELELAFHVAPDVPEYLAGDAGRLRQVIVNLVGNAIKFTEQGEVVLDVSCEAVRDGRARLHFEVRDTGIGIPPEKQEHVFQAFEQVDTSTTRRHGGTGLGLSIAARVVDLLGGEIWVESEVGRGSTFGFTAEFTVADEPSDVRVPARPESLVGMRVLVVDDNATNRLILDEMLRNWQMEPVCCADAASAVQELESAAESGRPFPLVLSDVNMPGEDGFTIAERIRGDDGLGGTCILMLTSGDRQADTRRASDLEAVCLIKPVKQSELFDAIVRALGPSVSSEPKPENGKRGPRLRPLRILLAEDSLANQKLAVGMLSRLDHEVRVVAEGRQAVETLRHESFDVVLMDVQMPVLDGLEATRAIREDEAGSGRHVPIVAMTAHAMKGDREKCLDAGMDDYVSKPIRVQAVTEAIARVRPDAVLADEESPAEGVAGTDAHEGLVDWDAALEVVAGDVELLADVVDAYRSERDDVLRRLVEGCANGDPAAVENFAHRLKGALRSFAAVGPQDVAERIEVLGKQGDAEAAARLLGELRSGIEGLDAEIDRFFAERAGP